MPVAPAKQFAKRRAAVTVACFFFRRELRKRLLNLREVKQRIVAETICASWRVEDDVRRKRIRLITRE